MLVKQSWMKWHIGENVKQLLFFFFNLSLLSFLQLSSELENQRDFYAAVVYPEGFFLIGKHTADELNKNSKLTLVHESP